MPKSKRVTSKPNGYALFAKHVQAQNAGMKQEEAFEIVRPMWEKMPEKIKQSWKEQAKSQKHDVEQFSMRSEGEIVRGLVPARPRKNKCRSVISREEQARQSLRYYEMDRRSEREHFFKKRDRDRKDIITYFEWSSPSRMEATFSDRLQYFRSERDFHLITMTPYYETADHLIVPAEISLVGFNLGTGIISQKHWILALPEFTNELSGYDEQALLRSSHQVFGHGIPLVTDPPPELGFRSAHGHVMGKISENTRRDHFVYVLRTEYNMVQGGIHWLKQKQMEETGYMSKSFTVERVKCIEDLVAAMMSLCACEGMRLNRELMDVIEKNVDPRLYGATPETACEFHQKIQKPDVCTLSRAKRILCAVFGQLKDPCFLELTDQHILDGITKREIIIPDVGLPSERTPDGVTSDKWEERKTEIWEPPILASTPVKKSGKGDYSGGYLASESSRCSLTSSTPERQTAADKEGSEDSGNLLCLVSEKTTENAEAATEEKHDESGTEGPSSRKNGVNLSTPLGNFLMRRQMMKAEESKGKSVQLKDVIPVGPHGFGRGRFIDS